MPDDRGRRSGRIAHPVADRRSSARRTTPGRNARRCGRSAWPQDRRPARAPPAAQASIKCAAHHPQAGSSSPSARLDDQPVGDESRDRAVELRGIRPHQLVAAHRDVARREAQPSPRRAPAGPSPRTGPVHAAAARRRRGSPPLAMRSSAAIGQRSHAGARAVQITAPSSITAALVIRRRGRILRQHGLHQREVACGQRQARHPLVPAPREPARGARWCRPPASAPRRRMRRPLSRCTRRCRAATEGRDIRRHDTAVLVRRSRWLRHAAGAPGADSPAAPTSAPHRRPAMPRAPRGSASARSHSASFGITRETWVCWSMTSLTRMPQAP